MSCKKQGRRWNVIRVPWHLDEQLPGFPIPICVAQTVGPALPDGGLLERLQALYEAVADATEQTSEPLLLTGDCTSALGAVVGLQRRFSNVAIVWLDGHGDFNTPSTTTTGYLGGMPLAMLTGRAPELLSDGLGLRPVSDNDVVLVDARDLDPAEHAALASSAVIRVPPKPGIVRAAVQRLGRMPTYLHVDVEVLDDVHLPGLRVPASMGPSLNDIEICLAAIADAANIVAVCIACTWLPNHISGRPAAQAVHRLARALGAELSW